MYSRRQYFFYRDLKQTSNFMTADRNAHKNRYKELKLEFVFNVYFNSASC